jgi:predicted CXXCH cytochrome family protein
MLLPSLVVSLLTLPLAAQVATKNSCLTCHAALDAPLGVPQETFAQDIHARKGLTCASCHGGDAASDDQERAMNRAAGFRGEIPRTQIPALCAGCHSDAAYMRKYNPSLRTDQLSQYQTSVHGKRLARGDAKVAVCSDCHGFHAIRPASDTRSNVHPLNIAQTCARCHANAEHMKGYSIPTDQFAGYSASVHHEALTLRGDLSAPTCATCHGTHGAAPPGVASVEFVCATCHVFQAQLFDTSPHKRAFATMGIAACTTCHGNHRINRANDTMIGTGQQSLCASCHSSEDAGYRTAGQMQAELLRLQTTILKAEEVLDRAERSGMEVSQAKLEQNQARDALTKARVTIHSFQLARLKADIEAGTKVAEKTRQAGVAALAERDYRRMGLAVSVVFILIVLTGLWLYIRQIEAPRDTNKQ